MIMFMSKLTQYEIIICLQPSGHYMYRTAVTACTAQWSLYVPHSGHYMYRTAVTVCTAQWSLYVPHSGHYMYRTVVTMCTTSLTFTNSTFSPHNCIYLFCVDLRTNSDYFPILHCVEEEDKSYKMQRQSHNQPYCSYSQDNSKDT